MTDSSTARPARIERLHPPTDLLLEREATATTHVIGPWSMSLRGAEIDDITFDGALILRSIRLIGRDEDWRTLPMHLDANGPQTGFHRTGEGFDLHGRGGADGSLFRWSLALQIDGDALVVTARVEATTSFRRNRLGLIVLHPPDLAGRPLAVEHPAGTTTTTFPERISPHQPARDIGALSWQALTAAAQGAAAVDCDLRFTGDVFEMEDQRNWTDASFKTYSTPLSEPFPVELARGTVVHQSVELRCAGPGRGRTSAEEPDPGRSLSAGVAFGAEDPTITLPHVTTSVSNGPGAGPQMFPAFGPLLCELDPGFAGWRAVLDRAVRESGGRALDLRLIVEQPDEVNPVLDVIRDANIAIDRVGVFDRSTHVSEPHLLVGLRRTLDDRGITADLLGGTRAHFTELNRNHARLAEWDGPLSFSITPFMHDRGGHQLVESIAMQRLVARDALDIAQGRPLHIGPITLGARFNAVATTPAPSPNEGTISEGFGAELVDGATDQRQSSPSLAAWVLASVAALTVSGVASLSYFEASGARGLVDADGHKTAAAEMLEVIATLSGGAVAPLLSDHPAIVGLAVAGRGDGADAGTRVALVGNLSDTPVTVEMDEVDSVTLQPGATTRIAIRGHSFPAGHASSTT
ncbi:hypothetical protein [Mycetocola sp. 2940]|uniref:hypothetical protein n=1 Tax=Mycetocola sp. 2940 TaxID=3156452 RepID=UPI003396DD60